MTFVLSFPRYTFTHLGCHLRQTGLDNLYTPYLCIGHMQANTLDHFYGRCILRWRNLTSTYTLSSAEAPPVRLVGQSSEGVPGLPSPSIHSPPMTCLHFRLSITSFAGTLLGYDAWHGCCCRRRKILRLYLRTIGRQFLTVALVAHAV